MHCKSYSHFFSKKFQRICVSPDVNFNESLTNDVVSFEQLGPGLLLYIEIFYSIQWFCLQTAKAQIRLCGWSDWSGPSLSAYVRRHVFYMTGPKWGLTFHYKQMEGQACISENRKKKVKKYLLSSVDFPKVWLWLNFTMYGITLFFLANLYLIYFGVGWVDYFRKTASHFPNTSWRVN